VTSYLWSQNKISTEVKAKIDTGLVLINLNVTLALTLTLLTLLTLTANLVLTPRISVCVYVCGSVLMFVSMVLVA